MKQTLFDKLWATHVITGETGAQQLLYVDFHYLHEVSSPQAFEGLRMANRAVRRLQQTLATMDHNVPTKNIEIIADEVAKTQMDALRKNCQDFKINLIDHGADQQGIVHVIGPELGITRPGQVIVCGDSHTATHGAFGALAFGIGTSEVEHVLATQTIWQKKSKNLRINLTGTLRKGVFAKDVILGFIAQHGTEVGIGYAIEYAGPVIGRLSMEERMTITNMSIECGAKIGMIAPDATTFAYLQTHAQLSDFTAFADLQTDADAVFDQEIEFNVDQLEPMVTYGSTPSMGIGITQPIPAYQNASEKKAYAYMGIEAGQLLTDIKIDYVFIGSCTNGRLSDLQDAASVINGRKVKTGVTALVVPGSRRVKQQAEQLGIDQIFLAAGFEWREPGCSMCLGMNADLVAPYAHCASSSNRNFEGRQGRNARTHLCSPAMAAMAAIHGRFVDLSQEVE